MLSAIVVAAGMLGLFTVALLLALWSERQREARIADRQRRELALARAKRNHPSFVAKTYRPAA